MINLITGLTLISSLYFAGTGPNILANKSLDTKVDNIPSVSVSVPTTVKAYSPNIIDILNTKEVESYLRKEFSETPILIEIARCESTFRQFDAEGHVIRGKVNSKDIGVMQINEYYHVESSVKLGMNIYTIQGNIDFAKYLYKKYGSQPWSASEKCWGDSHTLVKR